MVVLDLHALLDHRAPWVVHVVVPRAVQQQQVGQLEDEVGDLPLLHQQGTHGDAGEALTVRATAGRLPRSRRNLPAQSK